MKKVTAKNLMIGDWVKYRNEYWQVQRLDLKDFFGNNMVIELNGYPNPTISSATPIPITEEWLMLNGFELAPLTEKVIYSKSISKDCTIFHMSYNNVSSLYVTLYKKDTADIKCQTSIVGVEYIHQLQQAYRLATGKELKLKF